MNTSPPVVVEVPMDEKTEWLLSFGGSNPLDNECIELTRDQCFWLVEQIMNIDPNLFERARQVAKLQTQQE